ncbi:tripartite tricarboxylate transporter substrate binding protein [Rhodobacteraceae bacterium RKSG542]|uniref:Bug family tripartite tricarboxylate transporter substrate binding protein n=1 Tax=Pseudovibrio flavus TaxID=2529854 RepID=UPI0012BD228F|nr:tripartite tricarboxylate transporter substrate binding protein [Pseudovibrio flavus]MTI18135.1 tripartite tricarboxylate transporter substrate binding protein [Pseudovibrio flavus]
MKKFAGLLAATSLLLTSAAFSSGAMAQDWPDEEKVVSVVVPFAAGGGTDTAFRQLTEEVKKYLPARVQIVNISGAGSAKGTNEMLQMPADGYAVLASGTHTIGATMQGLTPGYDQLDQILGLNWDPFIVAVLKSRPYKDFDGLVAAAKEKPGSICLGNAGMGGATGLASVGINLKFDRAFNVTPFNGGQNLRADVLGGRCEAGIFSQSEILANAEELQPLVVLYENRSTLDALSHVPTLAETGHGDLAVPGGSYKSLAVHKDVPADVKKILADTFAQAFKSEAYAEFMANNGVIADFSEGDAAEAYFQSLVEGFEPLVREAGLYNKK